MRTASSLAVLFLSVFAIQSPAVSQEGGGFGGTQGTYLIGSYSPTSQHILISIAVQRKTAQAGVGYTHALKTWSNLKLMYEGSLEPLYLESDPTYIGESSPNPTGPPTVTMFPSPYRPIGLYGDFGYVYLGNGQSAVVAGISGPRESTYAFAALPLGVRVTGWTTRHFQPTFSVDLGGLYATRNIPVDYTSNFNFLAEAGPGLEVFLTRRRSVRAEYLYEHLSNANIGLQNPGVDSATFRLTLTRYK